MNNLKGDDALIFLRLYFDVREGYIVTYNYYGPNVPSNSIRVEGPDWFTLSYCPSWIAPQINCAFTKRNQQILKDIADSIEVR